MFKVKNLIGKIYLGLVGLEIAVGIILGKEGQGLRGWEVTLPCPGLSWGIYGFGILVDQDGY
jgi:hypothetical protein